MVMDAVCAKLVFLVRAESLNNKTCTFINKCAESLGEFPKGMCCSQPLFSASLQETGGQR